jgi:multidrug resistance protein, MATE family
MTAQETAAMPEALPGGPAEQSLKRRVLGLAAPVIGENLLQTLLMVVDTALVAALGAAALAGVGTALQFLFVLLGALSAFAVGSAVLVAQAVGAGDAQRAGDVARQSIVWSLIAAIPLSILGVALAEPLVAAFGLELDVQRVAVEYLHVTMATVATLLLMYMGSGILRGVGDSRTPMLITALANLINIFFSWALIYGHWGMPALGAVGSAWGTFISRLIGAALLLWVLFQGRNGVRIGGGSWRPRWPIAYNVLRIGGPAAIEEVLVIGAFVALTPIVAVLGTASLAAHRVVINALSLSFLPGIGFGLAATSLVGQSVGARDPRTAGRIAVIAVGWAIVWMGGFALLFFGWGRGMMELFSDDPALVEAGAQALWVVAATQPFWAITFVLAGALRGTGNTTFPLLVTGGFIWAAVGIAALLTQVWPALWAVWMAFVFVGPIESVLYWWGFRRWQRRQESI